MQADVSLIVLAPSVNDAARAELRCLGWELGGHEPGIYRLAGGPFTTWLVETDVMAQRGQPILSLVSGVFLSEHRRIIEELGRTGHARLLHYVLQQVAQFRSLGEDFAMQHKDSEYMGVLEEELQTAFLAALPVEKRLQGLAPEERLRGLAPEERLRGLVAEELADALSEEQAARLRKLLERQAKWRNQTPSFWVSGRTVRAMVVDACSKSTFSTATNGPSTKLGIARRGGEVVAAPPDETIQRLATLLGVPRRSDANGCRKRPTP